VKLGLQGQQASCKVNKLGLQGQQARFTALTKLLNKALWTEMDFIERVE
jgi:hypothetical protein